jgi:hypothetical protein
MSTTTRPRSPPGYLNQIRTHRPDAPMLHRLNCILLNELNSDIQPNYPANNPRFSRKKIRQLGLPKDIPLGFYARRVSWIHASRHKFHRGDD